MLRVKKHSQTLKRQSTNMGKSTKGTKKITPLAGFQPSIASGFELDVLDRMICTRFHALSKMYEILKVLLSQRIPQMSSLIKPTLSDEMNLKHEVLQSCCDNQER